MTGFFEENPGERSIMRLAFFITVISMIALAFVVEFRDTWNGWNSTLIAGVLSVSTWLKAQQRKYENG